MRAELRRARYGYLLALPLPVLCAAGRTPSEIAAVLFCSRSSVYRVVKAYRTGRLTCDDPTAAAAARVRLRVLTPSLKRSLVALLKRVPRVCGWCRTRWSCAPLAVEVQTRRALVVSAETGRRWLPELGWVWKRAKLVAKDDAPRRVEKLARMRSTFEQWGVGRALLFVDELDLSLRPKVGYQWMSNGAQVEVVPPGTHEKRYLAGALDLSTGAIAHCLWYRNTTGVVLDWLNTRDRTSPAAAFTRLYVVADNATIPTATEVAQGLAAHPRFELLFLPTYGPQASPIERTLGDVHDQCTRNHTRKRRWPLVRDIAQHLQVNGPWVYTLSDIYDTPEVTAAVQLLYSAQLAQEESSQLAA